MHRDICSLVCVSMSFKKQFELLTKLRMRINNEKLKKKYATEAFSQNKKLKSLELVGLFNDFDLLQRLLKSLESCNSLHLDCAALFWNGFELPYSFAARVTNLTLQGNIIEYIDLGVFPHLHSITLDGHPDGKTMAINIKKHANIKKMQLINCNFEANDEMSEYLFGNRELLDMIATRGSIPEIIDLSIIDCSFSSGGVTFTLFSLMPKWYPILRKFICHNSEIANLKVLQHHEDLHFFDLKQNFIKFQGVSCCEALKYLYLTAEIIHIDNCIADLKLNALRLKCRSLVSESHILSMPKCNIIEIETRNGKIYKTQEIWRFFSKSIWQIIDEADVLMMLNK